MQERPSDPPLSPKTEEQLIAYIREMLEWPSGAAEAGEGYGRCVYAVAYASVATFNYMANLLGITGFQASCADMKILEQTRDMKHSFMLLDGEKLLYPQYDLLERVRKWIEETRPTLAKVAREKLAEAGPQSKNPANPTVIQRWQEIAALEPETAST